MDIALPPDLEQYVREQVQSGQYDDENSVVATALQVLRHHEGAGLGDWTVEELRAELAPSIAELDRGGGMRIKDDDELARFFADVKERGRQRLAAAQKSASRPQAP